MNPRNRLRARQRGAMVRSQPEGRWAVDPLHSAPGGYAVRRRWLASAAAIAGVAISLLVPSAGSAAPDARAVPGASAARLLAPVGSPGELAALEARVARLTR